MATRTLCAKTFWGEGLVKLDECKLVAALMGTILMEVNNKKTGFLMMACGMNCDFVTLLELEF